jgi:hypothetical protein
MSSEDGELNEKEVVVVSRKSSPAADGDHGRAKDTVVDQKAFLQHRDHMVSRH